MYECPNCAGNLKFDISRQQLFCEYCGTQVDPYGYEKKRDAQEAEPLSEEYEVTVFTCPQCGGEILSEDGGDLLQLLRGLHHTGQPYQQGTASRIYHSLYQDKGGLQGRLWENAAPGHFCPKVLKG